MTPTNLSDTQVGARANILRTERGRTMDDLASQMRQMGHKWSRTTVHSIEHGERRLQLSEAADLVHCLGLDPLEGLLAFLSDPSEPDKAKALSEKRLLEKMRNLELAWEEFIQDADRNAQVFRQTTDEDADGLSIDPRGLEKNLLVAFARRVNERNRSIAMCDDGNEWDYATDGRCKEQQ